MSEPCECHAESVLCARCDRVLCPDVVYDCEGCKNELCGDCYENHSVLRMVDGFPQFVKCESLAQFGR